MDVIQALLAEFDQEAALTRTCLERVPQGKGGYQPHPKSMTLGRLAGHIVAIPSWITMTLQSDEFDLAPVDGPKPPLLDLDNPVALLEHFDRNVAAARAALAAAEEADLGRPWSLKNGGRVAFTLPKGVVLRRFVFSHTVHHRAQLTLYLRLNEVPVPSIYGPSADEGSL
jgi:uncharacterized damage-inducible protein DinB